MRAVLKNHSHQEVSAITPMVLFIKFVFKTEVEGHYPQENSFRHQSGTILQNQIKNLQVKDLENTVPIGCSIEG
jgi:hypothetical protein